MSGARSESLDRHVPEPNSGCWLWLGAVTHDGYARAGTGAFGTRYAHRIIFERERGPIPAGLELDHVCRVRSCVNPAHLEIVSHRENNARGTSPTSGHARKTHCFRGHAFDEKNTYSWRRAPGRYCRACRRDRERARRANAHL